MLIEYEFSNYRSFKDKTSLSMRASSQTTFNENLIRINNMRLLPSAVVYGANAGGKSNIIASLMLFRLIVDMGSINQSVFELNNLELCPFVHDDENNPINFKIDFIENGNRYIYKLSIKVGKLKKSERAIVSENLSKVKNNGETVLYQRNSNNVSLTKTKKVCDMLGVSESFIFEIENKINQNIDSTELFLCRGFKNIINSEIADSIINFFRKKLFVVKDFTLRSANLKFEASKKIDDNIVIWNKILDGFVKGADFGPQSIFFKLKSSEDEHSADATLCSLYSNKNEEHIIPAEFMESRGTLKLLDFAIVFEGLFKEGGVFVIDEFDAALHPEIVKGILTLFNSTYYNKAGAQLVFTTHNPIYLNNKIFRRDQIMFVEKDKESYKSALYSLADFGSEYVRNDENYLNNYFKGKYSSLPFIDFSELISTEEKNDALL